MVVVGVQEQVYGIELGIENVSSWRWNLRERVSSERRGRSLFEVACKGVEERGAR